MALLPSWLKVKDIQRGITCWQITITGIGEAKPSGRQLRASTQTFQYWHLVTTSLASDTGQRDGRCVQTGGQDSQMTEFTTITTDSELTIPGFRERAQDAPILGQCSV